MPRCGCVERDFICDENEICPALKPADKEGERGKNKTRMNISLYTIIIFVDVSLKQVHVGAKEKAFFQVAMNIYIFIIRSEK